MPVAMSIDRIAPTLRPASAHIGYQTWSDLLFVHWRVPAAEIAPLIPASLTVDTFDGDAWVALVPFRMSWVRARWLPPVPGVSWFCETNVRTYVHRDGRDPGVWFFSLDAASSLAVRVARSRWKLNYHRAGMSLHRSGDRVRYASRRLWPGERGAGCEIEAEIGPSLAGGDGPPGGCAAADTLEHFLAERYYLYTLDREARLLRGQVHHAPYPLREARVERCDETLLKAAGIAVAGPPDHVLFSEGVHVHIYPLVAAE